MKLQDSLKKFARDMAVKVYQASHPLKIVALAQIPHTKHTIVEAERFTVESQAAREYLAMQSYAPHENFTIERREIYAAELENAVFDLRTGLLRAKTGEVILETGVDEARVKTVSRSDIYRPISKMEGVYTSVWGQFTHNYGHWMIECLLRTYSLLKIREKYPTIQVLMPDSLSPLQKKTFEACLPEGIKPIYLNQHSRVQCEKFIFLLQATGGTSYYFPPQAHIQYVRERLFQHFNINPQTKPDKRIYIPRGKAAYRYIVNEEDVIRELGKRGFKPYFLEDMPIQEQMALFSQASMVVSPHSSGLINLLFAPPSIPVVEISSKAPEPSFYFLCLAMRQDYHYLFAREANPLRQFPSRQTAPQELRDLINSNFTVPIDELNHLLDKLLADS